MWRSRDPTRFVNVLPLFSAPTDWKVVSIPFLKFCQTQLTRLVRDSAIKSLSRAFSTSRLKFRISAEEFRLTITRKKRTITGSLFSALFMQEANTTRTTAAAMNTHSVLTDSDFVPPSSPRSTWKPKFTVTAGAISSISKKARPSAKWKRKNTPRGTRAHA